LRCDFWSKVSSLSFGHWSFSLHVPPFLFWIGVFFELRCDFGSKVSLGVFSRVKLTSRRSG
jgi:hypothetical protein